MRTRWALALGVLGVVAWSCDSGGAGEEAEAAKAALQTPPGAYEDPVFGLGFEVPEGFEARTDFENPGAPAGVIQRRVVVERPGGGLFVVDVWENAAGLSLDDWLSRYGPLARYRVGPTGPQGRFGPARLPGIRETVASPQSPRKDYAIIQAGGVVLRVLYVDRDSGGSQDAFERVLRSLRTGEDAP